MIHHDDAPTLEDLEDDLAARDLGVVIGGLIKRVQILETRQQLTSSALTEADDVDTDGPTLGDMIDAVQVNAVDLSGLAIGQEQNEDALRDNEATVSQAVAAAEAAGEAGVAAAELANDVADDALDRAEIARQNAAQAVQDAADAKEKAAQAAADAKQAAADGGAASQAAVDARAAADAARADADAATARAADAVSAAESARDDADTATAKAADAVTKAGEAKTDAAAAVSASSSAGTKAQQAYDASTTATSTANAAQTVATSKGEIIVQVSAPTGARALPQNLWIDISTDASGKPRNRPNRYNTATSKWEPVTDLAAVLAQSTADGAVTAAATADAKAVTADGKAVAAQSAAAAARARADALVQQAVNVILDPGFEDPTIWTPVLPSRFVLATDQKHAGARSVKAGPLSGGTVQSLPLTGDVPVQPGQTWRARVWRTVTSDYDGTSANGKLRLGDQNGTNRGEAAWGSAQAWTYLDIVYTVPATGVSTLNLVASVNHAAGNLWLDDVEFKNITDAKAALDAAATADAKAVSARTQADTALAAAGTAQTTADAKGQTIVQVSAPTGSRAVAQNLWIDISLDSSGKPKNTPNRWNESTAKWEPITDAIAANAATVAAAAKAAADVADGKAVTADGKAVTASQAAQAAQARADQAAFGTFARDADTTRPGVWMRAFYRNRQVPASVYTSTWIPSYADILGIAPTTVDYLSDADLSGSALWAVGDYYFALLRGIVSVTAQTTVTFTYSADDRTRIYVDGVSVKTTTGSGPAGTTAFVLDPGSHVVDFVLYENTGSDYINAVSPSIASQVSTLFPPKSLVLSDAAAQLANENARLAQSKADTAAQTAQTAQETANLKTRTLSGTGAPSGNGTAIGDIWLTIPDVSTGVWTAQYRWDGTAWKATTIGNALVAAIDAGKLTTGFLAAARIQAGTITGTMVAADTITAAQIAAGAVTASELAAGSVVAGKIAAGTITATEIAAGTITAQQIATGTIGAGQIAAGAITTVKLAAGAVTANEIAAGTITADRIATGTITAAQIAAGTITATQIATGTLTATQIAAGAIGTGQLAAGAVTADRIAAGTITGDRIKAGTITASTLAIGDFTNLVDDPEFQAGGWIRRSGAPTASNIVTTTGLPGPAWKLDGVSGEVSVWTTNYAMVDPGSPYWIGFRAQNQLTGTDTFGRLRLYWYTEAGTYITYSEIGVPGTATSWADYSGTFTAPATARRATPVFIHGNGATGGSWWFGRPRLRRLNGGELIVDGAITAAKVAAASITGDRIAANTLTAANIAAGTITAAELAAGSVTAAKISANTITAAQMAAGSVTTAVLAANAVTAAKIAAATITSAEIAAGTIQAGNIAAGTITGDKISAATISGTNIAGQTITGSLIAAATLTGDLIKAATISAANIAADTLTSREIAADAITAAELGADAVTARSIKAGEVVAGKLAADSVAAANIVAGTIATGHLAAGAVTAAKIAAGTITATELAAGSITTAKIAAGAVTANEIAALTITGDKLAANSITAGKIAANSITATQIAAGAIDGLTITGPTIRTAASGRRTETTGVGLAFYKTDGTIVGRLIPDDANTRVILGLPAADNPGNTKDYTLTVGPKASKITPSVTVGVASDSDAAFPNVWTDGIRGRDGTMWLDDTGWQNLTLKSGVTGSNAQWRRIGQWVKLRGEIRLSSGAAWAANTGVVTLPTGSRPATQEFYQIPGVGISYTRVVVGTDGQIDVGTVSGNTTYLELHPIVFLIN